ncbi:MAG: sugar ABC transporter substrate-binding protein, partial [Spirochaetota bacterium]
DILIGAHDWLGELVTSGIIASIDLGAKESEFTEAALAAFNYEGELYGMPYAVENVAFFYNPDLVPEPPATWDEVREISEELQSSGEAQYGFIRQEGDPYHFFPIQSAFGGYVFGTDSDGAYDPDEVGIDDEGSIESAIWLEEMVDEGLVPGGMDYDTYHSLFETGEAAMIITGPWALDRIEESGVNYEITSIPGGGQPFVGVQGFMVSAFSENQALATAFLTEFAATADVMFEIFELGGRTPAHLGALELVTDERLVAFGEVGLEGRPMPAIPEMNAVWDAWGDAVTLIMQEQVGGEEAFENAADQIRTTIAGE